jgi:hypothetical protein
MSLNILLIFFLAGMRTRGKLQRRWIDSINEISNEVVLEVETDWLNITF